MSMVLSGVGNLTRDPELRDAGGTSVTTLRLAWNTRQKVDGDWTEVPGYIDVVVWGRQAETACEFLAKGRQVFVSGELEPHSWTNGEGVERSEFRIARASVVKFVGSKGGDQQGSGGGSAESAVEDPGF